MDPLETGKALLMLAGIAGLYLKIHQAMRTMSGKGEAREISNDPLRVQETVRPATLDDVRRVERRVDRIETEIKDSKKDAQAWREKINDQLTEMRDRHDDRLTEIKDELRDITRAVGRLEGS